MSQYSTRSKLHCRMKSFGEWIAPNPDDRPGIKEQADEIRSRIKAKAEEDGLIVEQTPYSGSFSSKTGLRRQLRGETAVDGQDIDIPFVIKKDKETEFAPLVQRFVAYAEKSYPTTEIKATKSSVKMTFRGTKLSYDIVPMFAVADGKQMLMRETGEVITTSIEDHREFIRSRTKKTKETKGVVAFNHMIRFLKWWRLHKQQETGESIVLPSFLVNLMAAKALATCGVDTTYPQTLAKWFAYLAHTVRQKETIWFNDYYSKPQPDTTKPWNMLDPVMPGNNIVKSWAGWQVSELADWLTEAAEIMNRAIAADLQERDADSLKHMQALFGKIFSSHCN